MHPHRLPVCGVGEGAAVRAVSAAVLQTGSAIAVNENYAHNQTAALATLNQAEAALGSFGDGLQEVRQHLLAANNGGYGDADCQSIASALEQLRGQLLGLANSRDGAGAYLFAGFNESGAPFALTANGASYAGDDGERQIEVAPQRLMAVSVNGAAAFMRVPDGNGVFATLSNVISALQTPAVNGAGRAAVSNQVNAALTNVERTLDTALTARTSLGARQAGIARLQDITSAAGVEQQRRLSELQDLDYAQAASDLARGQTMIDANQQTFARLAKLSLFDYLR